MTVVFKLDRDGGFTAGDTATGRTSYAYPTSSYAVMAKRNPAKAAATMIRLANEDVVRVPHICEPHDAANWKRLGGRSQAKRETARDLMENLSLASLHAMREAVESIEDGYSRTDFVVSFDPALQDTMGREWDRAKELVDLVGSLDAASDLYRRIRNPQ